MFKKFKLYFVRVKKDGRLGAKSLLVFFHALLLVMFTILLQYTSLIQFDETEFYRFFTIVKNNVIGYDEKPVGDSIVYLDVSKDLQLVDDLDINSYDGNDSIDGGKLVITDRLKLALLFSCLNRHPGQYKAVICDIAFEDPSPYDSILSQELEKTQFAVFPAVKSGAIFHINYGSTEYFMNKGNFVKLPVFVNDSMKSLPVVMVESIKNKRYERWGELTLENGRFAFNTYLPEFYYRPGDILRNSKKGRRNCFYLGEMLKLPNYFTEVLQNKYIVIGNFSEDRHRTFLGEFPGSLILFDSFLSLRNKSIAIRVSWLVILFLSYFLLTYRIVFHQALKFEDIQKRIKIKLAEGFVKKYLSYFGIVILLNIISYFLSQGFVSLFFIASYFAMLDQIIEKFKVYKASKGVLEFVKNEVI